VSTDADLPESLSAWIVAQRWYADKGSVPRFERIGGWTIALDGVTINTHYVLAHGQGRATLYQVPLTERELPSDVATLVDIIETPAGKRHRYDATTDPIYAATLLQVMLDEREVLPAAGEEPYTGHRQPGAPDLIVTSARVLSGEQSNTSIICQVSAGNPVIIKVFRALHHGDNPDVELQSAIAAAGSNLVPTSVGSLSGSWSDTGRPEGRAHGDLAFAQEFLPGVEDAWRVALDAAESNTDFRERARALGVATAEVHSVLATALPTRPTEPSDVQAVLRSMRGRHAMAEAEVPALRDLHDRIDAIFAAAEAAVWPPLQRIHGDYHLGQVLWVKDRGWVLLDFEGEPLRAMDERSVPDITLRDVAGMLRSFDYVAGSVELGATIIDGSDAPPVTEWAAAARTAFTEGYAERSGTDLLAHRELLDAFELDKALYETVYEARNRPGWLSIPTDAIQRLVLRAPDTAS
jgi:maltokinase